jgi:hypothetical protein
MTDNSATLSVSWKTVAIAATIVALTALVICAIIATINKADTLSVVALGLAIIAFVIQILVFIVQAAVAAQQDLHAQEIYGSTLRVLATIEEKAEGTRRAVSTINDRMLVALLGKAIPETALAGVPVSSPEFSSAVAERVGELASQSRRENPSQTQLFIPGHSRPLRGDDSIYSFPEPNEVRRVAPALSDLGGDALSGLRYLGDDRANSSEMNGMRVIPGSVELYERGFVRRVRKDWSPDPVYVLTADGLIAARVLLARDLPNGVSAEATTIRAKLAKWDQEMDEQGRNLASQVPVEDEPSADD